MADIFQEVEEDVRREEYTKLWQRYGRFVIFGAVLVVAATAGWVQWQKVRANKQAETATAFDAARRLAESDPAKSVAAFDEIAQTHVGAYPVLARFAEAVLKLRQGNRDDALAIYDRIAADPKIEPVFRDAALLSAAMQTLDSAGTDEILKKLAPLAAETGAWRFSARELQGLVHLRNGDSKIARGIFLKLATDVETPPAMRKRATEIVDFIGNV